MSADATKLELINWISSLKDVNLLESLLILKQNSLIDKDKKRQPGWGKEYILYVAPDFDDTPPGFEEYMPG